MLSWLLHAAPMSYVLVTMIKASPPVAVRCVEAVESYIEYRGDLMQRCMDLQEHQMTLDFYRDMADKFELDGLDAASRATHPQLPPSRRRKPIHGRRRVAPPTPPPDEEAPPAPPRAVS